LHLLAIRLKAIDRCFDSADLVLEPSDLVFHRQRQSAIRTIQCRQVLSDIGTQMCQAIFEFTLSQTTIVNDFQHSAINDHFRIIQQDQLPARDSASDTDISKAMSQGDKGVGLCAPVQRRQTLTYTDQVH